MTKDMRVDADGCKPPFIKMFIKEERFKHFLGSNTHLRWDNPGSALLVFGWQFR